jgi:tripartite-type tricarboxylate transporter receptor subunit TctC
MYRTKRGFLIAAALLLAAPFAVGPSWAQGQWPDKPIKWIVPYAPGGFSDLRARQLAQRLGKSLGVSVVVENKTGAGGVIGTDAIAKAAPDGYTMGMGSLAPLAVNGSLMKRLPYDPLRDLQPVILIEKGPLFLMTNPASGINSVSDLIAKAKASPGTLGFASSGVGGAHHLSGEMLKMMAKIDLQHVPYKGGAPAAADLVAGHVPLMFEMGYSALPNLRAGKLRALAVSSAKRVSLVPDVPTLEEEGVKDFESYNWQGVVVPAGTPAAIVARLNKELNAALNSPDIRKSIEDTGAQVEGGSPEQFAGLIRKETAIWAKVVEAARIEPQ